MGTLRPAEVSTGEERIFGDLVPRIHRRLDRQKLVEFLRLGFTQDQPVELALENIDREHPASIDVVVTDLPEPISRERIEKLVLSWRQKNPADRLEIGRLRLELLRQLDQPPPCVRIGENPQPQSRMMEVLVLEGLRVWLD